MFFGFDVHVDHPIIKPFFTIGKINNDKHQVQSENADGAKNYSNGKTSPLKIVGGSKLTNFLLPKRTKVKGFQSSTSTNISLSTG